MKNLYGIVGWYADKVDENEVVGVTFGGFLIVENSRIITDGNLVDRLGNSRIIIGSITESELEFKKRYHKSRDDIEYKFRREGSLWVGRYKMYEKNGISEAITNLAPFQNVERLKTLKNL